MSANGHKTMPRATDRNQKDKQASEKDTWNILYHTLLHLRARQDERRCDKHGRDVRRHAAIEADSI